MGLVLLFSMAVFFLVEWLSPSFLTDPRQFMTTRSTGVALAGVALLTADVLLPVPSSLVMIAHGALFGVVLGTLLSLGGSLGAALTGFLAGRRGGPLLARVVPPEERVRADRLLARWGVFALMVTRPVPLLAETTAIMAGASTIGWGAVILASLVGSLLGVMNSVLP